MLEQLHVRNFRGFKDLRIESFGRVNLVAGRNNAGKTTLLEAIFLLASGGNCELALNRHVMRLESLTAALTSTAETVWAPCFFELDTDGRVEIYGRHSRIGEMSLIMALSRSITTGISRDKAIPHDAKRGAFRESFGEPVLKFTYVDPVAELESEARETATKIEFEQDNAYVPVDASILKPGGGNARNDAVQLGQLRRQKLGKLIVDALRVVEPRLQSMEDISSSGAPMIWVDIGLHELVPLPAMGSGMTHVTRLVLAAATVQGGVVLVDEIENGLHHSVLPDVWRIVKQVAEQFDVQVFATTHSFECVEAAYEALGADGFRLHRLDVDDGVNRCTTYEPEAIEGAIRHNLEVR